MHVNMSIFLAVMTLGLFAGAGAADICHDVVFSSPGQWNVDPSLSYLYNMTLPTHPSVFNGSFGVCNYYDGMPVCCSNDVLEAIALATNRSKQALSAARTSIDHEEMFATMIALLDLLVPNSTVHEDLVLLNSSILALKGAQAQCVNALNAYTEGMMCLSCAVNASQFVDVSTRSFLLSEDTCSGVVQRCTPVFDASRRILKNLLSIVSKLFPQDDSDFESLPDMCGGTEAAPGNCSEFMCNVWLNGVRIPGYAWNLEPSGNVTPPVEDSVSPRSVVARIRSMLNFPVSEESLRASVSANLYVSTGYPALLVGCADEDCSSPEVPAQESSHTLAIALGCGIGGALMVLAAIILVRRKSVAPSVDEGDRLMAGNKSYDTV